MEAHGSTGQEKSVFELHMLRCNDFIQEKKKYTNLVDEQGGICKIIILNLNVKYR